MKLPTLLLLLAAFLVGCAGSTNIKRNTSIHPRSQVKNVEFLLSVLTLPEGERRRSISFDHAYRHDVNEVHSEMNRLLARPERPVTVIWFNDWQPVIYRWSKLHSRLEFVSTDLLETDFLVHVESEKNGETHVRLGHLCFSVDRRHRRVEFTGFSIIDPPPR